MLDDRKALLARHSEKQGLLYTHQRHVYSRLMPSDYDASEFVDGDIPLRRQQPAAPMSAAAGIRAPSREEVDAKVAEAQQKLMELRRAQEELERERAALEETRRRQMEFQTGRQEMIQNLTRGLALLEESELAHRGEAEQTAKTLAGLKDALSKVQSIREDTWNKDNFQVELTRALTALENGRMEWNAARIKYPVLSGSMEKGSGGPSLESSGNLLDRYSFNDLCRLGFALTWPLALVALLALGLMAVVLFRK